MPATALSLLMRAHVPPPQLQAVHAQALEDGADVRRLQAWTHQLLMRRPHLVPWMLMYTGQATLVQIRLTLQAPVPVPLPVPVPVHEPGRA